MNHQINWYERGDLNPHDHNGHWILSPVRLPIPPRSHLFKDYQWNVLKASTLLILI